MSVGEVLLYIPPVAYYTTSKFSSANTAKISMIESHFGSLTSPDTHRHQSLK